MLPSSQAGHHLQPWGRRDRYGDIATSIDGFIARENGDLDWLPAAASGLGDEDHGYKAFIATVDAIVIGRHTYEKVRTFDTLPYD